MDFFNDSSQNILPVPDLFYIQKELVWHFHPSLESLAIKPHPDDSALSKKVKSSTSMVVVPTNSNPK